MGGAIIAATEYRSSGAVRVFGVRALSLVWGGGRADRFAVVLVPGPGPGRFVVG